MIVSSPVTMALTYYMVGHLRKKLAPMLVADPGRFLKYQKVYDDEDRDDE